MDCIVHEVTKSWTRLNDLWDFPSSSVGKESACQCGDVSLTPELGRSSGGRNGNPFQYSCLENPMDRGAWWATVRGVTQESDATE